jgi:hypothetical protein
MGRYSRPHWVSSRRLAFTEERPLLEETPAQMGKQVPVDMSVIAPMLLLLFVKMNLLRR